MRGLVLWTADELRGRSRAPGNHTLVKTLISALSLSALNSQGGTKGKIKKTKSGGWFKEDDHAAIVFLMKYILDNK